MPYKQQGLGSGRETEQGMQKRNMMVPSGHTAPETTVTCISIILLPSHMIV